MPSKKCWSASSQANLRVLRRTSGRFQPALFYGQGASSGGDLLHATFFHNRRSKRFRLPIRRTASEHADKSALPKFRVETDFIQEAGCRSVRDVSPLFPARTLPRATPTNRAKKLWLAPKSRRVARTSLAAYRFGVNSMASVWPVSFSVSGAPLSRASVYSVIASINFVPTDFFGFTIHEPFQSRFCAVRVRHGRPVDSAGCKKSTVLTVLFASTPGLIRTADRQIRNLLLYPTELRGRCRSRRSSR